MRGKIIFNNCDNIQVAKTAVFNDDGSLAIGTCEEDAQWFYLKRTCTNEANNPAYGFECSRCGFWQEEGNDYGNYVTFAEWNYCPRCGAEVVG